MRDRGKKSEVIERGCGAKGDKNRQTDQHSRQTNRQRQIVEQGPRRWPWCYHQNKTDETRVSEKREKKKKKRRKDTAREAWKRSH